MGLPTTSNKCNIGKCVDADISPHGEHSGHVQHQVTRRHSDVKHMAARMIKLARFGQAGSSEHVEVSLETRMDSIAAKRSGHDQVDAGLDHLKGEVADIVVRNDNGYTALDVVVTHPKDLDPNFAMDEAARLKVNLYSKWLADEFVPLSFSTFAGTALVTAKYWRRLSSMLANYVGKEAAVHLRRLKEAITVSVVSGQSRVIAEFNRRNGSSYWNVRGERESGEQVE